MPKDMLGMMGDKDDSEDEYSSESDSEPASELMTAARDAFPDQEWNEERLAALKELIHLCSETDYGEEPKKKSGDEGLALVFGKPKK